MQKRPLAGQSGLFHKIIFTPTGQVIGVGKSRVSNPNLYTEMLLKKLYSVFLKLNLQSG